MAALPAREKVALLRVVAALAVVDAALRRRPADRAARLVRLPLSFSPAGVAPPATAAGIPPDRRPELAMLERVVRRWPARQVTPCLRQALAIGILLRRSRPELRLGVASRHGRVFAHAWVEAAGQSFLGDPAFAALGDGPATRP